MPSPAKRAAAAKAPPEGRPSPKTNASTSTPCNAAYVAVQGVLTCQAYPPKNDRKFMKIPQKLSESHGFCDENGLFWKEVVSYWDYLVVSTII